MVRREHANSGRRIERLLRLVDEEQLLGDHQLQTLAKVAAVTNNDNLEERITQLFATKAVQHRSYPFTETPKLSPINLGTTPLQNPVGLDDDALNKHLLAVGQSGSGKTTLLCNLYDQIDQPVWFFDLKQDYRHLAQQDDDLLVLPWTELRFNPLQPPSGVTPRRWIQVFSEVFSHATSLLAGSKNYLLKTLGELYRLYGLFDERSSPYPSLHELETLTSEDNINYVRTTSNYRDRLLNRLEAMTLTAGSIFDCSRGYSIDELLTRNVVFEFDGVSRDVQNFLMEILFASVYEYRLAENHRGTGLNHVFVLDEGKRVFSVYKERQEASGIPEIDELTAKMREFGEGLIVADQEASKLTDSIKANTYTKVLLPTGDRTQFEAMTGAMNLSERQEAVASKLGVGQAIVQIGNRDPVPVDLDDYDLKKSVSDGDLRSLQADKWDRLSADPRETTPQFEMAVTSGSTQEIDETSPDDDSDDVSLSESGNRLLADVIENPFKPLTDRYDLFSSTYKGNKTKNELVQAGVVIERHVRSGAGKRKLLELTEKGRSYAEDELDRDVDRRGRGGIVHRYWQHHIAGVFDEAGWNAEIEKFDADLYVDMGTAELAVEIAMGNNAREVEHIEQHLERGFTVWVVCRTEEVRSGLEQRIVESDLSSENVVFRLFRGFSKNELPS